MYALSLIGFDAGRAIGNSLGTLRMLYALGVRYLTLTHSCPTQWGDAATDEAKHGGLTRFGKEVLRAMNRLGMMVDISHGSDGTMDDVLRDGLLYGFHQRHRFLSTFKTEKGTLAEVADHSDHIRKVACNDHVGIGADFGWLTQHPTGLDDLSRYPYLTAELIRRGYTHEEVKEVLGLNILRVMREFERAAVRIQRTRGPSTATIEGLRQ